MQESSLISPPSRLRRLSGSKIMSGHSKWANIKHRKAAVDAKKGKLFSKLAKEITMAVKESGSDTSMNMRLKLALAKAREANMPSRNIENAIKRGTGEIKGEDIVHVVYEGYGPAGVAIIVECTTDNKNRTLAEVRTTFSKNGGNLGEAGSVAWQFEKKGVVIIEKSEIKKEGEFIEKLMEWGASDFSLEGDVYVVYTAVKDFEAVLKKFEEEKTTVLDSEINNVAKNFIEISQENSDKLRILLERLEDIEDVEALASNEKVVL